MTDKKDIVYKVYKPFGMLSQFISNNDKQNRKKRFLGELYDFPEKIMPIGRLDEKSEGLLLLTTNGKWSDAINRSGIEKEYLAQLDGEITQDAIKKLQNGVEIGFAGKRYVTKPCSVTKMLEEPEIESPDPAIRIGTHRPNSWIRIIITEGKFRQVRKMTAAVGFPTLRLVRVRIGDICLKTMKPSTIEKVRSSETKLFSNLTLEK